MTSIVIINDRKLGPVIATDSKSSVLDKGTRSYSAIKFYEAGNMIVTGSGNQWVITRFGAIAHLMGEYYNDKFNDDVVHSIKDLLIQEIEYWKVNHNSQVDTYSTDIYIVDEDKVYELKMNDTGDYCEFTYGTWEEYTKYNNGWSFVAHGSGAPRIEKYLHKNYSDLSIRTVELARRAIQSAISQDKHSGGRITVWSVDKDDVPTVFDRHFKQSKQSKYTYIELYVAEFINSIVKILKSLLNNMLDNQPFSTYSSLTYCFIKSLLCTYRFNLPLRH